MATRRDGLARRRAAMGFTQETLAEHLGLERSTVGRWERGTGTPQPWNSPTSPKPSVSPRTCSLIFSMSTQSIQSMRVSSPAVLSCSSRRAARSRTSPGQIGTKRDKPACWSRRGQSPGRSRFCTRLREARWTAVGS
ncbi:MAG TPA: helix-turn-helix transcriptional regulator [Kribbella sp.]|nr:helix-turn-helix transcriptional regulator [Kribbella sp.]